MDETYQNVIYQMTQDTLDKSFFHVAWDVSEETLYHTVLRSNRVGDAYQDLQDAIMVELKYARRSYTGGASNPFNPYAGKYM